MREKEKKIRLELESQAAAAGGDVMMGRLPGTSRKAILYVLRELGRRAGATAEWIARWRAHFEDRSVTLYPRPDSNVRIVFPFDPSKPARAAQLLDAAPSHLTWMHLPDNPDLASIPGFCVFFDDRAESGVPLFMAVDSEVVACRADILTSALWTLARLEESISGASDEHGRFPAAASVAFRARCLDRPVVDEYAMALQQALLFLLPGWTPEPPQLILKLSHDIDLVGLPRRIRSMAGHLYPRRAPRSCARDVLSALGIGLPAYLQAVFELARISRQRGFDSAFYWKASGPTGWDSGYPLNHPKVLAVIEELLSQGIEMGVHPAYDTFGSEDRLQRELERLRSALGSGPLGGRQHFLRWRPATWRAWERAGLAYDSSVGFADSIGFRAGTAIPYHPWLMEEDRESALLEIPLLVMDCTPIQYMGLDAAETVGRVAGLVRRCQPAGGVFTLLWHNSSVLEPPYAKLYPEILRLFQPRPHYDWRAGLAIPALPREQ
jgi:hypothetical protein